MTNKDVDINLRTEEEITEELKRVLGAKTEVTPPKVRRLCGDIPAELFTEFKIEVIKCRLTMAQAVEQAVKLWLDKQQEETEKLIAKAEEEVKQLTKGGTRG